MLPGGGSLLDSAEDESVGICVIEQTLFAYFFSIRSKTAGHVSFALNPVTVHTSVYSTSEGISKYAKGIVVLGSS